MSLEETLSTLDYAHRAKNIKNRPEINQRVTKAALINNLTNDLVRLQQQLNSQRSKDGVYLSKDDYDEMEGAIKRKTERVEELELLLEAKIQDLHNATVKILFFSFCTLDQKKKRRDIHDERREYAMMTILGTASLFSLPPTENV